MPKTQMDVFNDQVINVPLEDEDLLKTARFLPRSENNGVVPINLKKVRFEILPQMWIDSTKKDIWGTLLA